MTTLAPHHRDGSLAADATSTAQSPAGARWAVRPRLLATGLTLGILGLIAGLVLRATTPSADGELRLDIWLSEHRPRWAQDLGQLVHTGLSPVVAPLILLAICGLLWLRRDRVGAVVTLALTGLGWTSIEVGKLAFHRDRPPAGVVHALVAESDASFPSGHVAFVAALTIALAVAARLAGRSMAPVLWLGLPLVAFVALERLWTGAHYLGDVLAAPLYAWGTVLVVCAVGAPALAWLRTRLG